jgi:Fanconi anemia group M protein
VNAPNSTNGQVAPRLTIIADTREIASGIPRALSHKGIEVRVQRLEVGDYLLSPQVAVERKTTSDFIQSIFDKRLFEQVSALRNGFVSPLLLVEKSSAPPREIHASALRGAFLHVAVVNRIPILYTDDAMDSVETLYNILQIVQPAGFGEFSPPARRRRPSPAKRQRTVLESIPGIGRQLAHTLLRHFGNLQAVFNATPVDLMNVPGIGEIRADKIRALLQNNYRT